MEGPREGLLDSNIDLCYIWYMDNTRKATLFAALAAVSAASSIPLAVNQSVNHGLLVLPLVLMGILLFISRVLLGTSS